MRYLLTALLNMVPLVSGAQGSVTQLPTIFTTEETKVTVNTPASDRTDPHPSITKRSSDHFPKEDDIMDPGSKGAWETCPDTLGKQPTTTDSSPLPSRDSSEEADSVLKAVEAIRNRLSHIHSEADLGDISQLKELNQLKKLLQEGQDPNEQVVLEDTPLLMLCSEINWAWNYKNLDFYARVIDEAIITLLEHGADALHENRLGCNAVFFLQGSPRLMDKLNEKKLLPRELSVRIPYEPAALARYIKLRVQQEKFYTTCWESKLYLSRRYCTPAYDRALDLLEGYLNAETGKQLRTDGAIINTLQFLRLGDTERIETYINELPIWDHGEHFLEEVPALFLTSLNQLAWRVSPDKLHKALQKLASLLPRSGEEMIDCHASLPMGQLLEMIYLQEGEKSLSTIQHYASSRDAELSYKALSILLKHQGLPQPEPEALAKVFGMEQGSSTSSLTPLQCRLYECTYVDRAVREDAWSGVSADMIIRVQRAWSDMRLTKHAQLLGSLLSETKSIVSDKHALTSIHCAYVELPSPSPRTVLARYILEHPETFTHPKEAGE